MLSEAKKQLIGNTWHQVQNLSCGCVTTARVWMVHHHEFSASNKRPDELAINLTDVVLPVVSLQGSKVNNTVAGTTQKNQSMLLATDQGANLLPNDLVKHSYST